jgi:carbohydrate kinase (thermoresistant glucokinase family)
MVVIVMGVSGSGKTTIGRLLAAELGWSFLEGDDFHPRANVEKMAAGLPLDDADRLPWLHALRDLVDRCLATGENAVLACSALRRSYRQILGTDRPEVSLVHLQGSFAQIDRRLAARQGHFMPRALLASQIAALEEPQEGEAVAVSVDGTPEEIVRKIRVQLAL